MTIDLCKCSWTCGNLKIMLISLERLIFASIEISEQYSKQLNAISIISLFKSKC
jgi:hypothetical protein